MINNIINFINSIELNLTGGFAIATIYLYLYIIYIVLKPDNKNKTEK